MAVTFTLDALDTTIVAVSASRPEMEDSADAVITALLAHSPPSCMRDRALAVAVKKCTLPLCTRMAPPDDAVKLAELPCWSSPTSMRLSLEADRDPALASAATSAPADATMYDNGPGTLICTNTLLLQASGSRERINAPVGLTYSPSRLTRLAGPVMETGALPSPRATLTSMGPDTTRPEKPPGGGFTVTVDGGALTSH